MSFGNILGQLMQEGVRGRSRGRLDASLGNLGAAGGGRDVLASLQNALGQGGSGGAMGAARDFLTQKQVGGMSGAQIGGAGAVAGALFGGGVGGAARGGALAVLGTLALTALRASQAKAGGAAPAEIAPEEVAAVAGPGSARLMIRAMIAAAKADGQIDQDEMRKISGKIEGDATDAERAFVKSELAAPLDLAALAAEANGPTQAAEIYAASLMAIEADTEAERDHLRKLAAALKLDAAAVAELHRMTGAPAA